MQDLVFLMNSIRHVAGTDFLKLPVSKWIQPHQPTDFLLTLWSTAEKSLSTNGGFSLSYLLMRQAHFRILG